ncbi:MAG: hypothetical protein ACMVP2_20550 [Imperialibacter sp.]|uniref:hypothetical protein n=1 Tax=Imperialibacter sp. TaxID=2038411 RepID=UPI003A8998E0
MKTFAPIGLTLVSLFALSSCCDDPDPLSYRYIDFGVSDSTSGNWLFGSPYIFPPDSFKMLHEDLTEADWDIVNETIRLYSFADIATDPTLFSEEICKLYYLHFDQANIDTVQVCFQGKEKKCEDIFAYLKVTYNGKKVFEDKNNSYGAYAAVAR